MNPLLAINPDQANMLGTDAGAAPIQRGRPASPMMPSPAPQPQNALRAAGPGAWEQPKQNNSLARSALVSFQRALDPNGAQAREGREAAAGADKKQAMLAMIQEQRKVPEAGRMQWYQQNMPLIEQATGIKLAGRQFDPSEFSDQALDAQIAALAGPQEQAAPMSEYQRQQLAQQEAELALNRDKFKHEQANPDPAKQTNKQRFDGGDGFIYSWDPQTNKTEPVIGPDGQPMRAPAGKDGISLQFGEGGALSSLSVGGTGTKGNEPAIVRGPDGQPVVTPGEQQLRANKSWQSLEAANLKTGLVRQEIDRALELVGPWSTGAGASLAGLPIFGNSTEAGRLKNVLMTIKANVGFDELQQMRENSPTGGALGQVAVQEINFLQSVLGSLEQAQRPEDVTFNLKRLNEYLGTRDQRRSEAFARDYPDLAQYAGFASDARGGSARATADAAIAPGSIEDGFRFKGGNPGDPKNWERVQ